MKSTIRKSTFKAIYRLLDRVSPVPYDCGTLCGCACCVPQDNDADATGSDEDLGIYLLPGEEKLFTGKEDWITWNYDNVDDYDFPDSWSGKIAFLSCNTPPVCDRKMRPMQCRTYPVTPHLMPLQDPLMNPPQDPLINRLQDPHLNSNEVNASDTFSADNCENAELIDSPSGNKEKLILILSDMEAPYICPLIKENSNSNPQSKDEKYVLDERFLKATYTVWKRLIKDPKIYDLVKMDSEERDFFVPAYPKF